MNNKQIRKQHPKQKVKTVYIKEESNGFAVAGFVLSLLIPILGIIFSPIGLSRAQSLKSKKGLGLSIAGIVISCLAILIGIIVAIAKTKK